MVCMGLGSTLFSCTIVFCNSRIFARVFSKFSLIFLLNINGKSLSTPSRRFEGPVDHARPTHRNPSDFPSRRRERSSPGGRLRRGGQTRRAAGRQRLRERWEARPPAAEEGSARGPSTTCTAARRSTSSPASPSSPPSSASPGTS
uniref:Uncharacterized protein n=1 Tax=Oryza punctata TaxID=4537 RepID=A0A0E0MNH4_ORYPU